VVNLSLQQKLRVGGFRDLDILYPAPGVHFEHGAGERAQGVALGINRDNLDAPGPWGAIEPSNERTDRSHLADAFGQQSQGSEQAEDGPGISLMRGAKGDQGFDAPMAFEIFDVTAANQPALAVADHA
jgi:hypothetical protein